MYVKEHFTGYKGDQCLLLSQTKIQLKLALSHCKINHIVDKSFRKTTPTLRKQKFNNHATVFSMSQLFEALLFMLNGAVGGQ
ncbi:MAG: hypothetical protein IPL22_13940 [Bacteroidetes bacterium]|nr:hypothetical protein [Bacteroidota bacterium]